MQAINPQNVKYVHLSHPYIVNSGYKKPWVLYIYFADGDYSSFNMNTEKEGVDFIKSLGFTVLPEFNKDLWEASQNK